jgi:hypothetical protein
MTQNVDSVEKSTRGVRTSSPLTSSPDISKGILNPAPIAIQAVASGRSESILESTFPFVFTDK